MNKVNFFDLFARWESQVNALVESHRAQELQLKQTEERLNDVQQELERRRAAQVRLNPS